MYWMKLQGVVENKLAFNKLLLDHDVWTWSTRVLRRGSVSIYGIRLCFVMFHVVQILDNNKRQSVGCGHYLMWKFVLGGKYGRLVVVVGEKFLVMVEEMILRGCNFGWGHSLNFGKS